MLNKIEETIKNNWPSRDLIPKRRKLIGIVADCARVQGLRHSEIQVLFARALDRAIDHEFCVEFEELLQGLEENR